MKKKVRKVETGAWTIKELRLIYKLRSKNKKSFGEISKEIKRSASSIRQKYVRTNWELFFKDQAMYLRSTDRRKSNAWSQTEMIQLDAFIRADKSYDFISAMLSRNYASVERKAQTTDWKAWRSIDPTERQEGLAEATEAEKVAFLKQLIDALLNICRHNPDKFNTMEEDEFLRRVNLDKDRLYIPFAELKAKASDELKKLGFGNKENLRLKEGTYVIVGDSHGKHTKKEMFALLREVNKFIKPTRIIHVGHILDDDNDISYEWGNFKNLTVLAKIDELKTIQDQRNKFNFNYDIIRETITLGDDLVLFNQDMITDYVITPIKNLDTQIFDEKIIVNCHRHEFFSRCSNSGKSYFASPGCLCDNHIVRTIKQIDFTDGKVVKLAFWEGFSKYRRMKHTNKYWEKGLLIVHVNKDGTHTIVPCRVKHTNKGETIAYFDKMISSKGVFNPDKKIFVNGDMHCDMQDNNILDVQESVCKDYKPDMYVNLGDTFNYSSLNHHIMDRGGAITKKLMDEAAQTYFVLKRVAKWALKRYMIYGNHERFAVDFVEKYPQLQDYLDFGFICNLGKLGYRLTKFKQVLKIGSAKFIHGEITMYGQTGAKIEKTSRTFGKDVFIGHIHYPSIRFGCYSVGLTGNLDQEYNEPDASQWIHGLGLCNQYKGQTWMTTVAIVDNKCNLKGKIYAPINPDSWNLTQYKVRLQYDVS